MRRIPVSLGGLAALAALALTACDATPFSSPQGEEVALHGDHSAHLTSQAPRGAGSAPDLARIRAGTSAYHTLENALADGFVDPSGEDQCVEHPALGGMGVHYVNFARWGKVEVDPSSPEILLYEPMSNGRMRLVGVEFAVPAEPWHDLHGPDVYPELAGVQFDPPVAGHESPIVASSYTLHVWSWRNNPQGMFFPFNPKVSCGN